MKVLVVYLLLCLLYFYINGTLLIWYITVVSLDSNGTVTLLIFILFMYLIEMRLLKSKVKATYSSFANKTNKNKAQNIYLKC